MLRRERFASAFFKVGEFGARRGGSGLLEVGFLAKEFAAENHPLLVSVDDFRDLWCFVERVMDKAEALEEIALSIRSTNANVALLRLRFFGKAQKIVRVVMAPTQAAAERVGRGHRTQGAMM